MLLISILSSSKRDALTLSSAASVERPKPVQTGVYWDEASQINLCFLNLDKSDSGFSPNTRYKDHAINERLFHWETQSTTTPTSKVGARYVQHGTNGTNVALFVRECKRNALGSAAAYCCLGLADYVKHSGERPIAITWKLRTPMPGDMFSSFRAAVA